MVKNAKDLEFNSVSVGEFDPSNLVEDLNEELIDQLSSLLVNGSLDLKPGEIFRYATLVKHPGWKKKAGSLDSEVLGRLIRLFTLGEKQYSEWIADDKSPVIIFVKELKSRGEFEPAINKWIKSNTSNKFLPHGSLMDLL